MGAIQDFVNNENSALLGIKTSLDTLTTNVQALKDAISAAVAAGQAPSPADVALLGDVLTQTQALAGQASALASASTPPAAPTP